MIKHSAYVFPLNLHMSFIRWVYGLFCFPTISGVIWTDFYIIPNFSTKCNAVGN